MEDMRVGGEEASLVLWLQQTDWAGLDGVPLPTTELGLSWACRVCSGQVDARWVGN